MALTATKLIVKTGLLGGAVYLTTANGIWGENPEPGIKAFKQFTKTVDGQLGGEYLGKVPKLNMTETWNSAVSYSIDKMADAPNLVAKSYESVKEKLK